VDKKHGTVCGIIGLIIGIVGGIAGTAYSMGVERQRINDTLITNKTKIEAVDLEMGRYAGIMVSHITVISALQTSIHELTTTVGNLRTDVQVLKALMERMEKDIQPK